MQSGGTDAVMGSARNTCYFLHVFDVPPIAGDSEPAESHSLEQRAQQEHIFDSDGDDFGDDVVKSREEALSDWFRTRAHKREKELTHKRRCKTKTSE